MLCTCSFFPAYVRSFVGGARRRTAAPGPCRRRRRAARCPADFCRNATTSEVTRTISTRYFSRSVPVWGIYLLCAGRARVHWYLRCVGDWRHTHTASLLSASPFSPAAIAKVSAHGAPVAPARFPCVWDVRVGRVERWRGVVLHGGGRGDASRHAPLCPSPSALPTPSQCVHALSFFTRSLYCIRALFPSALQFLLFFFCGARALPGPPFRLAASCAGVIFRVSSPLSHTLLSPCRAFAPTQECFALLRLGSSARCKLCAAPSFASAASLLPSRLHRLGQTATTRFFAIGTPTRRQCGTRCSTLTVLHWQSR